MMSSADCDHRNPEVWSRWEVKIEGTNVRSEDSEGSDLVDGEARGKCAGATE